MKTVKNKKRFLFQLNHPAHYHLFKNIIQILENKGYKILISIKDKDILKDLVKNYSYVQISVGYRKKFIYSILKSVIDRDKKLLKIVKDFKPDLMIGTSPEIGHISPLAKIPALFFGEDDVDLSIPMYLGALTCYPFFDCILTPSCVNNSIWNRKTVFYEGFQKLAYLHPNRFTPQRRLVDIDKSNKYFIIRFSALTAYHDNGVSGITDLLARRIISKLLPYGKVLISSERTLPNDLEEYRFRENLDYMHHYLAYANLFIGDSQTMCAEAGLLGTPFIRYNDFVDKIGYLNEIEKKYQLGFGIKTGNEDVLIDKMIELLNTPEIKKIFNARKNRMLKEKIDVTSFFVWFIENYPESKRKMKENPDYQYNFK